MSAQANSARKLGGVLLCLMALQAVLGLALQDVYWDEPWIRATWFGNDCVTLGVVVPLLALSLVRRGNNEPRWTLLRVGLQAYALYNYAFYLLGAALNVFFPLYVALAWCAALALAQTLRAVDFANLPAAYRGKGRVRAVVSAYLLFVAGGLATVWLGMWIGFAFRGLPLPVDMEVFRLVAALDLLLLVPALASAGSLLWRAHPWGFLLAPAASACASLYLLVLAVNSVVLVQRQLVPPPSELPVWGSLWLLTTLAAATLFAGFGSAPGPDQKSELSKV